MFNPCEPEISFEGEIARITYENHNTGYRVLKFILETTLEAKTPFLRLPAGASVTLVGHFSSINVGVRLRVRGLRIFDERYGEQIKVLSSTELAPSSLLGLERYLASGLIAGIGPSFAKRIVDHFGMDTLRVLEQETYRLNEVSGLGKKRIESVVKAWADQKESRDVMVFMQSLQIPTSLALRVYKFYGAQSEKIIRENPYRLALEIWGVGFKTADKIAEYLGVSKDSETRFEAAIIQTLNDHSGSGHVYCPWAKLLFHCAELLSLPSFELELPLNDAANRLEERELIVIETPKEVAPQHGTEWHEEWDQTLPATPPAFPLSRRFYLMRMWQHETRLAAQVLLRTKLGNFESFSEKKISEACDLFESRLGLTLASEQREAIKMAATYRFLIITGGPGVGKTTLVRALLHLFEEVHLEVRLAAPTGRAAKRLSDATGHEASTLHRLLEFDPKLNAFKRNGENLLSGDVFIIDESSMIDLALADSLFWAIPEGARIFLVGDVDQLPSVGPGNVFSDLIDSNLVTVARLSRIFRQNEHSFIAYNAHRVNHGEMPLAAKPGELTDFYRIEPKDPSDTLNLIRDLIAERIPKRFGFDPLRDVQILTPTHKGVLGAEALNQLIQQILNPEGFTLRYGERQFRVGDKVMQLKNDYENNIWNGDIGFVSALMEEKASLEVVYDDHKKVTYSKANLDELNLAYACTIHKSQGSEYPVVIVPLSSVHYMMLRRKLVYTAITRGKRLVILLCQPGALKLALSEERREERDSGMKEKLLDPGL